MKRFIKLVSILCVIFICINVVPAQQLQTDDRGRINHYTKATLPEPGQSGRIARVSDDTFLFYFDTGTTWVPITGGGIALEYFGGKGDGASDNRASFNAAIAALNGTGLSIQLRGDYAITGPLDGAYSNVTIEAVSGATIRHIHGGPAPVYAGILHHDFGRYAGWTMRGIKFDGGSSGDYHYTFFFSATRNITFENCEFRRLHGYLSGQGLDSITIRNCKFWGTAPGVMQAGVQDPPALASAEFAGAINFNGNSNNVTIEGNYFHFCETGAAHSGSSTDHSRTWRVRNNTFRGDWFNMPYIIYRGVATAYDNTTKILTFGAGGLTGVWKDYRMIAIPVTLKTGANFANSFANVITFSSGVGILREGDIIECSDGKRAEIISQLSPTQVTVAGWESSDTFEFTTPPSAVNWRITRLYSAAAIIRSNTTVQLYNEPVNPFTGELMISGAGLSPVGKNCRVFALQNYSGFHNNGGLDDLEIGPGNKFRGSRSDQCSNFDTNQVRIHDNWFEMGFDEDITLTNCPGASVSNNQHRLTGVTGVIINSGDGAKVSGEKFNSWGVVNRSNQGGIAGYGLGMSFTGCTFDRLPGGGGIGGASDYAIIFFAAESSAGTVVAGNADNGARVSSLYVSAGTGKITVRDLHSITGPGASEVLPGFSGDGNRAGFASVIFSATPTFNASSGNIHKLVLRGNVSSSILSNARAGQHITFIICQDSIGNRAFVWPASVKGAMTISLRANRCSCQSFVYDGSTAWATGPGVTDQ